ncbi:TPA: hypothetical protein ACROC8_002869, partial [Staphylococcus aureus]
RQLNLNTGVSLCQKFLSRIKNSSNTLTSTFDEQFQKDCYFYIVSRQEETRSHSFQKEGFVRFRTNP